MSEVGRVYSVAQLSASQPQSCGAPAGSAAARQPGAANAENEPRPEDESSGQLLQLLPRLWRFALRLTKDSHDAEELVQRAYIRALARRHQLRPGTSMITLLFSSVSSIWLNELRGRRVRGYDSMQRSDELSEKVPNAGAFEPERQALHRQIVRMVQTLPDAQRAAMLLVAVEGLSHREAASVLEIPVGAVKSRLARARRSIGESCNTRIEHPPSVALS
jgi:RNA polymerase sigma-70 factor (ECF subfamily)